jgi:1-acyl-sn-glycerol-3-phosphate acyltransferase
LKTPTPLDHFLRWSFFGIVVRFVTLIVLGLNVRHRERLPSKGPAIIVANHNSHLDTLVLMTLFPQSLLRHIHPVAALDYFLKNPFIAWFAQCIIQIVPIQRSGGSKALATTLETLRQGKLLIFFPEGTRGEPEKMIQFKRGIALVAQECPEVPVIPLYLHGLGKALPKGEALLVPFFCDVFVGEALKWEGNRELFLSTLNERMLGLASEGNFKNWD